MDNFIKEICFTEDWIKNKRKHTSDNITLIEKTIHAFALLGYLVQSEFEFIFKGGTCILLHVPIVKRLSIDIDIIFGGNIDDFQKFLSEIPGNSPFTRYEEDERGARGLPNRKHFKFFYLSSISNEEESVLLDIVLEDIEHIQYTESKLIKTEYFDTVFDLSANIPTIEGLLGDKLTAFAPHTIGVPFKTEKGDSMTMQVAKQLFDIGELFNIATDFDKLSKSFRNTYTVESTYRENTFTEEHVLHDIIDISALICHINLTGYKDREDSDNIKDGVSRLVSHLVNNSKFSIDKDLKITAAKVFFIANSIKYNRTHNLQELRFTDENINEIRDVSLDKPYNFLNKLKQIVPEAFYYIWQGIKE